MSFFLRFLAKATLPNSVAHSVNYIPLLNGLKVCHTFCCLHVLRHGSLLHCSKQLHSLRSISPAALGFILLRSFQSLLTMPAAHNFARLLVALGCGAFTVFVRKTKTPPAPCVYNIGRTRALVGTPVLPPKAPLAGRLAKAAQLSANRFAKSYTICSQFFHRTAAGAITPTP